MNDKELIQALQNIKYYCVGRGCKYCKFHNKNDCQLKRLISVMYTTPQFWDMKKIEDIINE